MASGVKRNESECRLLFRATEPFGSRVGTHTFRVAVGHLSKNVLALCRVGAIGIHASTIHHSGIHRASHPAIHVVHPVHAWSDADVHGFHTGSHRGNTGRVESFTFVFFAHAIYMRPESLLKPAYLPEYLFAAQHLFLTITCRRNIS